ncbi:MAG: FtsX-like permease family protein [Gammaproteobacteria bacterium]
MNYLTQLVTVTMLNLGNLRYRVGPSLVAVVGFAGVVLVFVGVLSIGRGFSSALEGSGRDDLVVVLRAGSTSEMVSGLSFETTRVVADAPGVARDAAGALSSPELFVLVDVEKISTGQAANVPFRGVTSRVFDVRGGLRIVEGRRFEQGVNEVIIGHRAAAEFVGLEVGGVLRSGRVEWDIVGIFDSGGSSLESEVWTDARVLQDAYNRGSSYQVVYAKLESADAYDTFAGALASDARLNVEATRETDHLAAQSQVMTTFISVAGTFIALLMGIGAVFGAINTMYTTVAARAGEIATLRALGFGRLPVLASVLVEGMVLGVAGGVIGGAFAYFVFNGYQASTLNFQSFSQVAFAFAVTPGLLAAGVLGALLMGLLGGILPGVRAARMPIAKALREL